MNALVEAIRASVKSAERDIGEGGVELRMRESKACLDLLVVDRLLPFSPTIGSRWQSREAGLEAIVLQGRLCRVEVDVPRRRYSSRASDLSPPSFVDRIVANRVARQL